jgi:mRNA interferase RelE/StbE
MTSWSVEFTTEAEKERAALDRSQRLQVDKAIYKVSQNPLPQSEGGYGKPLGNKQSNDLTGLLKIKLLKLGIRIVYKIIRTDEIMKIIVIAVRADIVDRLGIAEGDKLEVTEKDGAIYLMPVVVYPKKYLDELRREIHDAKTKIAAGQYPTFDSVDALFSKLEGN